MTQWFFLITVVTAACTTTPPSVRAYAAELPARADGQYATLDEPIQKQLVLKDALLQCAIDRADGRTEAQSAACRCALSSGLWLDDCRDWLGAHTPKDPTP